MPGDLEVLVAIHRIVDQQVAGEHFAVDPLSFVTCPGNGLQRLPAGVVYQVNRNAQDFRNANRAVGSFAFDLGWS